MATATARVLDARPDRLDLRDFTYRPPLRSLPPRFPCDADMARFLPGYVQAGLVRDQGTEGACTGFGLACVANYLFWVRHAQSGDATPYRAVSPRMFYQLARRYDEWPGTDYEGSSCRGALKGWHKHGACADALWPYPLDRYGKPVFVRPDPAWTEDAAGRPLGVYYRVDKRSIVDLQAAIADIGAVYVSATAHDGWDALDRRGRRPLPAPMAHALLPEIEPIRQQKSRGGHAFALIGYNERGFVVQNSWGRAWGASGFAVLPYDDWVAHATDAWACALGVPARVRPGGRAAPRAVVASAWRVGSGKSLAGLETEVRQPHNPPEDPWPFDHPFNHEPYEPWPTGEAYAHTLVTGNDGAVMPTHVEHGPEDAEGLARQIVRETPLVWFGAHPASALKVVVYAHGGLNGEEESIRRNRVLGPCFEANDIYPLFLTWKTGPGETLGDMLEDWARRVLGDEAMRSRGLLEELGEAKDRLVESAARVLLKGVWTEMKENAQRSLRTGYGIDLLARQLQDLQADLQAGGRRLELHLVGHSAGSILLGHLLTRLVQLGGPLSIGSTTLLAPACTSRFALDHYLEAQRHGLLSLRDLHVYALSDANEKDDGLPSTRVPAYGKSLLYLVSRALEDVHKTPILGMERALLAQYADDDRQWDAGQLADIRAWRAAWPAGPRMHVVASKDVRTTREGGSTQAAHGSFDNNIAVMQEVIERIRGAAVPPLEWLDYD